MVLGQPRCWRFLAASANRYNKTNASFPRVPPTRTMASTTLQQPFETLSPAVSKFVRVLEDYRKENYGQTLYSRYVKQMVSAMDANGDGKISRQELRSLLQNIGAMSSQEHHLTDDDLQAVVDELGVEAGADTPKEIHVECVQDLILSVYHKGKEGV